MGTVKFVVGVILPYVALLVFLGGMIWRIRTWKKMPSPPITLFPAPASERDNMIHTIKEMLLFPSLFKNDRLLWVLAWTFHAVLLLVFVGHFRVFTNVDAILLAIGMTEEQIKAMSSTAGGAAGIVIMLAAILLFVRRLNVSRVREITGIGDYMALLLLAAIIITGNIMRFGSEHFELALTRQYFADLLLFRGVSGAEALENNVFVVHMGLACILILWIPFSKILHFGGIFFTHQLVRKN